MTAAYQDQGKVIGLPTFSVSLQKDLNQDFIGDADVPGILGWLSSTQSRTVLLRPNGWTGLFPILFRHPVMHAKDLIAQVPSGHKLGDGRCLLDPEEVTAQKNPDWRAGDCPAVPIDPSQTAYDRLMLKFKNNRFGPGYNTVPYEVSNVHGVYPSASGTPTAVGSGRTWLMLAPTSPFKILYTCFQSRTSAVWPTVDPVNKVSNLEEEKRLGVTTGGGWHEIGIQDVAGNPPNYAETIINSLEPDPIPLGSGVQHPGPVLGEDLQQDHYAYSLSDVVSVRWLFPGEAQVTVPGESSWGYDQGKSSATQADFHWFLFPYDREVCTEEWVHPCLPDQSNHIGLSCPPKAN